MIRLLQEFSEIWDLISQLVSRSKLQDGLILRLTDNSLQSMTLAGVEAIQFRVLPLLVAVRQMIQRLLFESYISAGLQGLSRASWTYCQ